MFISIHIPKTAGTSLGHLFDYGSGRRVLWDYKPDYSNALMEEPAYWLEHKSFIERQFDFIHGHFFYQKYADIFPDAVYVTCLRHPVHRIVSQYNHILHEQDESEWLYRYIVENDMDVVDFAAMDGIHNAQSLHLQGRSVENYDFVFISEWLDMSFAAFCKRYRFRYLDPYASADSEVRVPGINRRKKAFEVTRAMQEKIYGVATEDVELYKRGCQRSEQLIRSISAMPG